MLMWTDPEGVILSVGLPRGVRRTGRPLATQEWESAANLPVLAEILEPTGMGSAGPACPGDDLSDLPALRRVALPAAVRDGVPEVVEGACGRGTRADGLGDVRENSETVRRRQRGSNEIGGTLLSGSRRRWVNES